MAQSEQRRGIPTSLSIDEFDEFVCPFLTEGRRGPKSKVTLHAVFNYILQALYLGCPWKSLPIANVGTVNLFGALRGSARMGAMKRATKPAAPGTDVDKLISYGGYRFPPEVISYAVWLYFRFPLSLRMVEEMLAARGIEATYETVRSAAISVHQRRTTPIPPRHARLAGLKLATTCAIMPLSHGLRRNIINDLESDHVWHRKASTAVRGVIDP